MKNKKRLVPINKNTCISTDINIESMSFDKVYAQTNENESIISINMKNSNDQIVHKKYAIKGATEEVRLQQFNDFILMFNKPSTINVESYIKKYLL